MEEEPASETTSEPQIDYAAVNVNSQNSEDRSEHSSDDETETDFSPMNGEWLWNGKGLVKIRDTDSATFWSHEIRFIFRLELVLVSFARP